MPGDPVRAADTQAWLDYALKDLRRVQLLLAAAPPDVEGALFHSQQAAEKALKGFLTWHDIAFRMVHELSEIGRQCLQGRPDPRRTLAADQFLDKICSRFPLPRGCLPAYPGRG
jgi:HEPN domain-containing protein